MEMNFLLQLLQLLGPAVVAAAFVTALKVRIDLEMQNCHSQITALQTSFAKLGDILTQIAVQRTEITIMQRQIEDLRNGRGFISSNLTGEYTHRGKVEN